MKAAFCSIRPRGVVLGACVALILAAKPVAADPPPDQTLDPTVDPHGEGGALKTQVETGGAYDPYSGSASRMVKDLDVPGEMGSSLDVVRYWSSGGYGEAGDTPGPFGQCAWTHSHHWFAVEEYEVKYFDGEKGGHDRATEIEFFRLNIRFPDGRSITARDQRSNLDPNYQTAPRLGSWSVGARVTDRVVVVASDAYGVVSFHVHRSDGGTVLFERSAYGASAGRIHRATKIWDRHGLLTTLEYTDPATPWVTRVREPAGRFVRFTYNLIANGPPWPLVTRVESGRDANNPNDVWQGVDYAYTGVPDGGSGFGNTAKLVQVTYANEPAPGQSTSAFYTYQWRAGWAGGNNGSGATIAGHFLETADDPHFDGPMNRIRYTYQDPNQIRPPTDANCNVVTNYAPSQQYFLYRPGYGAIKEERHFDGQFVVSRLVFPCAANTIQHAKRKEQIIRGDGTVIGERMFYYGIWPTFYGSSGAIPSELGVLTNFTQTASQSVAATPAPLPPGPAAVYQRAVYDFRNQPITLVQDALEHVTRVTHHADGSFHTFSYDPSAGTPARDATAIPNPYECWIFAKTDELNFTTSFVRDERRRVARVIYPGNGANQDEVFTYNPFNQVLSHQLPSGGLWTFEYDARGRKTSATITPLGQPTERTEWTYYGPGDHPEWTDRVKDERNPRAIALGLAYSARMEYNGRGQVTKVHYPQTDATVDPSVTYTYDPRGNCIQITDELGHWKTFAYDEYRRCTAYSEQLAAPDWKCTPGVTVASRTWEWDYNRWEASLGWRDWRSHTKRDWRLMVEPVFNAAGDRRASVRYHDIEDRVGAEQTGWVISGATGAWSYDPNGDAETHSFAYDANGNKTYYLDPRNRPTTYEFDGRNRQTAVHEPLGRDTYTYYDFAGNKTGVLFPDGRSQSWTGYDAWGQPAQFFDERNNQTVFGYYGWGPMKKRAWVKTFRAKDVGGTEEQVNWAWFDQLGRPTGFYFPDGSYEAISYEHGAIKTWRNREGVTKTISGYDARGRETYHVFSDGVTPAVTTSWDAAGRRTGLSNTFNGSPTPFCALDFGYDAAGQLWWEGSNVAGSGGRVQTTFYRYPNGSVGHVSYPSGFWLRRDWTARGQLKATGSDDGAGNWQYKLAEYVWHPDGKFFCMNHGNGLGSSAEYDAAGRVLTTNTYGGSPFASLAYRAYELRDPRDRILSIRKGGDSWANPLENQRGDRFQYDEEGQLTHAYYEGQNPTGSFAGWLREDHFTYDQLGNRQGGNYLASRLNWLSFLRRDTGLNEYSHWQVSVVNYDRAGHQDGLNGVLVQEGTFSSAFNALKQPIWLWNQFISPGGQSVLCFGYDPLGRCVKRWNGIPENKASNPATYFYYEDWNLIQEGPSASFVERYNVHGARTDEIVASYGNANQEWHFHHYDARTHCILLTGNGGRIVEQYAYDAFGWPHVYAPNGVEYASSATTDFAQRRPVSAVGNRFLFTGREWLADLRIYDYRHRLYHPELGRFLQPDPKHFEAGDFNLYRYCHNDPINRVDPDGLLSLLIYDSRSPKREGNVGNGEWFKATAEANKVFDKKIDVADHKTFSNAIGAAAKMSAAAGEKFENIGILDHGGPGDMRIGDHSIKANSAEWKALSELVKPSKEGGTIMLLGCQVGRYSLGKGYLQDLANSGNRTVIGWPGDVRTGGWTGKIYGGGQRIIVAPAGEPPKEIP